MTDSERIKEIERWAGFNDSRLAKELGLKTSQTFYDIHKGKHGISGLLARKILDRFPQLEERWLYTGEGSMLKPDESQSFLPEGFASLLSSYEKIASSMEKIADSSYNVSESNRILAQSNSELVKKLAQLMDELNELRDRRSKLYPQPENNPSVASDKTHPINKP